MSLGQVNLSELFQFDELYWLPSEKVEPTTVHLEAIDTTVKKQADKVPDTIVIHYPVISTPWVVIGQISEAEKSILKQVFSAAPLNLADADWSILELQDIPTDFIEFIKNTQAKKYIFLGDHSSNIKNHLPLSEFTEILDSKVLVFPRLISSLTDSEKQLKLVFWNQLKALV